MLRLGMLRLALRFGLLGLLSGSLLRLIRLLLSVGSSRSVLLLFTLLGLFGLTLLSGRLSVGAILCLLLFLGFVKTADIGICQKVGGTILRADSVTLVERFGLFATSVHLYHGTRTLCRDGDKIGCYRLIGRICHQSGKNVGLEEIPVAVNGLQYDVACRHFASCFNVIVNLIVETALQFCAHSGKLLRIERDVLKACRVSAYAHKILHPCCAAKLTAARSGSTYASCLLSSTNLFHLNAHMEGVSQNLDELSEVNALVGDIVEYRLVAVALILHVAYLHLQSEVLCYLTALYHGAVFAAFCLIILVHVSRLCNAIDALYFVGRLQICLLHLQFYKSSGQRHYSDVVSGTCFYSHGVALLQVEMIDIVIVTLSCILELHLYQVGILLVSGHVIQPVVGVELSVLPTASAVAEPAIGVAGYMELHVLEFFHLFACYIYY